MKNQAGSPGFGIQGKISGHMCFIVLNPISLLIDQMRGTSDEYLTSWVGCLNMRTNHYVPQENKSSFPTVTTWDLIVVAYMRTNRLLPKSSWSITREGWTFHLYIAHHQGRMSFPVVVCHFSEYPKPPELWDLNVCNMQDPYKKVSQWLQVIREFIDFTFPQAFDKISMTYRLDSMRKNLLAHRLTISEIR